MERYIRGITAGIIAAILMIVWDFLSFYILQFHDHLYLNWASVLIYGRLPDNTAEYIFCFITKIAWAGFLGLLFALAVPFEKSRRYLVLGAFYGYIINFIHFSISHLFQVPGLTDFSNATFIAHSIGATGWGFLLALIITYQKRSDNG